jgi:hypothetical protein
MLLAMGVWWLALVLLLGGCFSVQSQFGTVSVDRDPKGALSGKVALNADAIYQAWADRKKKPAPDAKQLDESKQIAEDGPDTKQIVDPKLGPNFGWSQWWADLFGTQSNAVPAAGQ